MRLGIFGIVVMFCFCGSDEMSSNPKSNKPLNTTLFLGLDPSSYLTGNFDSKKVLIAFPSEDGKEHFLREDVLRSYQDMLDEFEKSIESKNRQKIFLVSSFRSFEQQKSIWESKFTGKKPMRTSIKGKSREEIVDLILEYSSAPGTSRHHWGTDFDINFLENEYFETKGKGGFIYKWLDEKAKNFGFCQPYNTKSKRENKGYNEEKWHWSYAPVAVELQKEWIRLYDSSQITMNTKFLGADVLGYRVKDFVAYTNPDCLKIAEEYIKRK